MLRWKMLRCLDGLPRRIRRQNLNHSHNQKSATANKSLVKVSKNNINLRIVENYLAPISTSNVKVSSPRLTLTSTTSPGTYSFRAYT